MEYDSPRAATYRRWCTTPSVPCEAISSSAYYGIAIPEVTNVERLKPFVLIEYGALSLAWVGAQNLNPK
jgi:hypothetical protein